MNLQLTALVAAFAAAFAVPAEVSRPSLVPLPAKVEWRDGQFELNAGTTIIFSDAGSEKEAQKLAAMLRPATGLPLPVKSMRRDLANSIVLGLPHGQQDLGNEGYHLSVKTGDVSILAAAPAGLFYGSQTLRQLLPPEVFAKSRQDRAKWVIPSCNIEDRPRFGWRGFMLDYSRHFFTKEYTLHLLDAMAANKLNVFHMHLTDDEGWRIEIKKYPKLTEIGAWRGSECAIPASADPKRDAPGTTRYGGFFTQDDIREIVARAAELHINVMPEIDLPGHSLAICTAYPGTQPGRLSSETSVQGFKNNAISPAKEANYQMVDDIIAEVAALFPFDYIHIGGDEVNHNLWKECPDIKALVEREQLGGLGGAQVYFTKRLEGILAKHNRKMIGWNEIFNERLSKTTGIMAWIGTGPGFHAARRGYPVVMAPGPHAYFDMPYPDANDEPPSHWWAGPVGTERCYAFNPLDEKENLAPDQSKNIFGVHSALWTEFVTPWKSKSGWADFNSNGETVDFKVFPRLCALAEIGWTPQALRDYENFASRLGPDHLRRLHALGVNFRVPSPDAVVRKGSIHILPPYPGAKILYTLDGSDPFNSATAATWEGAPLKGNGAKFNARTLLDGRFSPLRGGARTEPAGAWNSKTVTAEFKTQEFDVASQLDEPGIWRLAFRKTGGSRHLDVRGVELLVNGAVVAKDIHDGGTEARGVYRLVVTNPVAADAKVTMRVEMKSGTNNGKPDSAGNMILTRSAGIEPEASVSTAIGHYGDNTPGRMADHDGATFFWTDRGVRKGETVTVAFKEAVSLSRIECVTGKLDKPTEDILVSGELGISANGTDFRKVADFTYGAAKAQLAGERVKAVRITVTGDTGSNWVVFQDLLLQ